MSDLTRVTAIPPNYTTKEDNYKYLEFELQEEYDYYISQLLTEINHYKSSTARVDAFFENNPAFGWVYAHQSNWGSTARMEVEANKEYKFIVNEEGFNKGYRLWDIQVLFFSGEGTSGYLGKEVIYGDNSTEITFTTPANTKGVYLNVEMLGAASAREQYKFWELHKVGQEPVVVGYELVTEDTVHIINTVRVKAEAKEGYELTNEGVHWDFQDKPIEVEATIPRRTNNTLHIPEIEGVIYADIANDGELESGDYSIDTGATIVPYAANEHMYRVVNGDSTWPFVEYDEITPEEPTEFERYVVIPDVEGIEYFDGMTGEVLPPGERMIGGRLVINTRLVAEDAFLTNPGATWTYDRPGGITASTPNTLSSAGIFYVRMHSEIEYVIRETGEVAKPTTVREGNEWQHKYTVPPSGFATIYPRAIGNAFLNNPYDEWKIGSLRRGIEVRARLNSELDMDGSLLPWRNLEETFNDYIEVKVNGEIITEQYSYPLETGDFEVTVRLKDTPPDRWELDWDYDDDGVPKNVYIQGVGDIQNVIYFEQTGDPMVLRARGTFPSSREIAVIVVEFNEVKSRNYDTPKMEVQMTTGFRVKIPYSNRYGIETLQVEPRDFSEFARIIVNGKELTDFENVDGNRGRIEMPAGYKEFKLQLTNPDAVWEDFMQVRRTSLLIGGKLFDGGMKHFEPDENGDLVWKGIWPEEDAFGILLIFPYIPATTVLKNIAADPVIWNKRESTIVVPNQFNVSFIDMDTGKIWPPGEHSLTRTTRMRPIPTEKVRKEGQTYAIYSVTMENGTFWLFTYNPLESGFIDVTAQPPTRNGPMVIIPPSEEVFYWDEIGRENVTGEIDLRRRRFMKVRIKPFVKYESYRLTNEHEVWEFTYDLEVHSVKPMRELNKVKIPNIVGVEYYDRDTTRAVEGTLTIEKTLRIAARAIGDYKLVSTVNAWDFEYMTIEKERVTAAPPTSDENWLTVPEINGVRYYDQETNKTLTGLIYIRKDTVVGVEASSEWFEVVNKEETWSFKYIETALKEVIIKDMDPRLVVQVNGQRIIGDSFAVGIDKEVMINLGLTKHAEFQTLPFLKDMDGEEIPFEEGNNRQTAFLNINFEDNRTVELHANDIIQRGKAVYFMGEHTSLQVRNNTDDTYYTLQPGQTGNMNIGDNYTFVVYADSEYEFDSRGTVKYRGRTHLIGRNEGDTRVTATYSISGITDEVWVDMSAIQLTEETDINTIGYNNLYIVDEEILNNVSLEMLLMKRQFMIQTGSGGLNYDSYLITDPHTYIINTIQLPFTIAEEDISNRERITLGYTELYPSAYRLNKDKIHLDLGTIYTQPKYRNAYDYKSTTVTLHLPYSQPVILEPNYVIGQTVSIEYLVDAYNGHTTINLRSSLVEDNVFHTTETFIGNEIPFISMKDGSTVGNTSAIRTTINNNTPTPYVEVVRNKPFQLDSTFNRDATESVDNLQHTKGRVYVHNITLELDTTYAETNTIKAILSGGVTIK